MGHPRPGGPGVGVFQGDAPAHRGDVREGYVIENPAARDIPRSFISGQEAGFQPVAERVRAAGWDTYHLDSGHDPMISHPRELADILLRIAGLPTGSGR